jgi:SPP1 family predicted phage head-tail adaptor
VRKLGEFAKDGLEQAQYYNMRIGLHKDNYVDANSMTRLVNVYAPTLTTDGQGGYTTTFNLEKTVWGDYRPQEQNRALLEAELSFTRMAKIFIRFDINITDIYKLEVEGQMYTIHSIKDVDNARRFFEIIMYV